MAKKFDDTSANEAIASGKVTVIDLWATWCGPCIALGPVIEELAEKYEGMAEIGKYNIDENSELVGQYGVRSIPTILFFKDGQLADKHVGSATLSILEDKLKKLLS